MRKGWQNIKTFVVLAVGIVLVSILYCSLAMGTPPMPNDLQMVEPDPSVPKEIVGFWGKWEGEDQNMRVFVIIEKIDGEKASVYRWKSGRGRYSGVIIEGWERFEAKVTKEYGKYIIWRRVSVAGGSSSGIVEYTLEGEYMNYSYSTAISGSIWLTRVP